MKKIETTYKEFFEMVRNNPEKEFYVKTHKEEFSRVFGSVEKESDMLYVTIGGNKRIHCSTEHYFMDRNGNPIAAKDLKINTKIMSLNGLLPVTSVKKSKEKTCYDISIEHPHWYVNDESGIFHHNTAFCLLMAKSYLDKYKDSVVLFFDSEFGANLNYFASFGIDLGRVLHLPVVDLEQLKFELIQQIDKLEENDKIFIILDSLGGLESKKATTDALDGKSTVDMTRAKTIRSILRMVTPRLSLKSIPMHIVNHTYKEQGAMYPKDIIAGGQSSLLSSDNVYIIGRQQEKDGTELNGFNFIINVEKSRYVKEKSKIPISVSFETGISKYSGLLDIAMELGFLQKPSNGWYAKVNTKTGEIEEKKYRAKETNTKEFWEPILNSQEFKDAVYNRYSISSHSIISDDEIEEEFNQTEGEEDV